MAQDNRYFEFEDGSSTCSHLFVSMNTCFVIRSMGTAIKTGKGCIRLTTNYLCGVLVWISVSSYNRCYFGFGCVR